jgi:hypothetical protein
MLQVLAKTNLMLGTGVFFCVLFQLMHDPFMIVTGVEGQEEASKACNCWKEGALRNGSGPCSGRFAIRGQGPKGITCRADWMR